MNNRKTPVRNYSLLKQRFNFSAKIGNSNYSYRELLSGLKGENFHKEIRQALLDEAFELVDSGFYNLIQDRNINAKELGYENYWIMKNSYNSTTISNFLIRMDRELIKRSGGLKHKPGTHPSSNALPAELYVELDEAFIFFCSLLFKDQEIPLMELKLRKGNQCPPGPPSVHPLSYRPGRGHILGMDLPFIHENKIEQEKLGALFHELTHLFHFASIDNRGVYAFPPELAENNLIYESEALCFQNLVLSAWKGGTYSPDFEMYKDLIYLAETERQLYTLNLVNSKNIKNLIMQRIDEHYPDGNFGRTPIGASHLIYEEHAAKYWIYPAAHWMSFQRISKILKNESFLSVPHYWAEGNEASYSLELNDLLNSQNLNSFLTEANLLAPEHLVRRDSEEIRRELEEMGLMEVLMGVKGTGG